MNKETRPSREEVLNAAVGCGMATIPNNNPIAVQGLWTSFERFAAAMYAKGAEDMRERAAVECDAYAETTPFGFMSRGAAKDCRNAIRALPITPTNTEGEQG